MVPERDDEDGSDENPTPLPSPPSTPDQLHCARPDRTRPKALHSVQRAITLHRAPRPRARCTDRTASRSSGKGFRPVGPRKVGTTRP